MSTSLVLSLAAGIIILFLLALAFMSRRRDERMIVQPQPLPPVRATHGNGPARRVDVALGRELLQLLENGQRPEAIALVSERTGWGTQEASEAVERLDSLRKRVSS